MPLTVPLLSAFDQSNAGAPLGCSPGGERRGFGG